MITNPKSRKVASMLMALEIFRVLPLLMLLQCRIESSHWSASNSAQGCSSIRYYKRLLKWSGTSASLLLTFVTASESWSRLIGTLYNDELRTFKVSALIECLTAVLECIDLILVGRDVFTPTTKLHCTYSGIGRNIHLLNFCPQSED